MNKQDALDLMGSSKTVFEWNINRELVLNEFEGSEKERTELIAHIDGSGLIKKVLKWDDAVTAKFE